MASPAVKSHLGKVALISLVNKIFGGLQSREWESRFHTLVSNVVDRFWDAAPDLRDPSASMILVELDEMAGQETVQHEIKKFRSSFLKAVHALSAYVPSSDEAGMVVDRVVRIVDTLNGKPARESRDADLSGHAAALIPQFLIDATQSTQVCSSDGQSLSYSDGCSITCGSGSFASQCYLESMDFVGDDIVSTFHTECASCPAGYYDFGHSSSRTRTCDYCSACSVGTYSLGGASTCTPCSTTCPTSSSLTGTATCPSTSKDTQCQCNAGFSQGTALGAPVSGSFGSSSGVVCTACVDGSTYASSAGQSSCTACTVCSSPSTITATACTTTTNTKCQCAPGYAGFLGGFDGSSQTCTACVSGKYQSQAGQSSCVDCPANSFSGVGATSCTCNQGYSGSACTACGASTYMDTVGGTCQTCPSTSSHSLSAQTAITACQCPAGTFGLITSSSSTCTSCPQGYYQSSVGQATCTQCPAHSSTVATGSTSASQCLCDAGYTFSSGSCVPCGAGSYKSAALSNDGCTACPAHSTSDEASTSISACGCSAGYTGVASVSGCIQCDSGTFKTVVGSGACSICSTSHMASTSSSTADCACDKGYSGDSSSCSACAISYYKDTVASGSCTSCGAHMTTTTIATTSSAGCICVAGYAGSGSCTACLGSEGKYQDEQGGTSCKTCSVCPAHSTETSSCGGTVNARCRCNSHYVRSDAGTGSFDAASGTTCNACSTSQYAVAGTATCLDCSASCPSHTTKTGDCSDSADTQCECASGYYGSTSGSFAANSDATCQGCPTGYYSSSSGAQSCDTCGPNTYASSIGSSSCTPCPENSSHSGTGKKSSTDCTCNSGYTANDSGSTRVCTLAVVVPQPTPTPTPDNGPKLEWWVWLLVAIGAVLVIGLIVFLVRRRSKVGPEPSFDDIFQAPSQQIQVQPQAQPSMQWQESGAYVSPWRSNPLYVPRRG